MTICLAQRLEGIRVPAVWQKNIAAERMLLLSPFAAESQRRQPARLANRRNEVVLALADQILLLHAALGSHTEQLLRATEQLPLLTLTLDNETLCRHL